MLSADKAKDIILSQAELTVPMRRGIEEIQNLVLAEPVVADCPIPMFDNSAMDGYAVRYEDLQSASKETPITLTSLRYVPAGIHETTRLQSGQCYQIATGSELPPGADTVVMKESVTVDGDQITFTRSPKKGENVRLMGEDIPEGETVLFPGTVLIPGKIALLAAFGVSEVQVYSPLRVAVLTTGSELVDIDRKPKPGQIRDTNSYMLSGLVKEESCTCRRLGITPDIPEALKETLQMALTADMVLISGGVSVGEHDYVKPVLEELGVEELFWKAAIKPGKPFFFGKKEQCLVFGMPGNPASSYVVFEEFVRPAIRKIMGHSKFENPIVQAQLQAPITQRSGRRQFLRAQLEEDNGQFYVKPMPFQGSHSLRSLAGANSLIIVPENSGEFKEGDFVNVRMTDSNLSHLPKH